VIYNPEDTGSIIQEAANVAETMDLSFNAKPISSGREVPSALRDLIKKTDVFWSVADGTVFTPQSIEYILLNTLRTEMPFVGLSPPFVEAGALYALSCDYTDIGKQTAEIVSRILSGEDPGDIPVTVPRKVSLSINLRTAKHIGLRIPGDIIKSADMVIK
jgi:putative ABC transport system substrate-binding protein